MISSSLSFLNYHLSNPERVSDLFHLGALGDEACRRFMLSLPALAVPHWRVNHNESPSKIVFMEMYIRWFHPPYNFFHIRLIIWRLLPHKNAACCQSLYRMLIFYIADLYWPSGVTSEPRFFFFSKSSAKFEYDYCPVCLVQSILEINYSK